MNVDCPDIEKLLSAYIDGELGRTEAQAVASHLTFCASCQRDVKDLGRAKKILTDEPKTTLPEWEAARMEVTVLEKLAVPNTRRFWVVGAGVALAAGLAVMVFFNRPLVEPVPFSVFLAEHSRTMSRTALVRRTAFVANNYYSDHAQN